MTHHAEQDEIHQWEVALNERGERLDRFLLGKLASADRLVSRSVLQGWIKEGQVLLNGKKAKPSHPVAVADQVMLVIRPAVPKVLEAESIELVVLHEDEDLIVVDKACGMVVHPGAGNDAGTLVHALLHHCGGQLCFLAGEDRPGIVHRLDKDTSGCLVAAKSERAYHSLVAQFSSRATYKRYVAVTRGVPVSAEGTITNRIGRHPHHRQRMAVLEAPAGKEAVTDYSVVRQDEAGSWATVLCVIHTGRTHQIRVHLKENLRCPILGDVIYGKSGRGGGDASRLMLHAWDLHFDHPASGERLRIQSALPEAFHPYVDGVAG